jgi:GT2 family glycosyltransferase
MTSGRRTALDRSPPLTNTLQVAMAARVSVITTVRDGERTLPALFDALGAQSLPADALEVVVIDNASRDGTAAVARELGATVVTEPVPGRARARNRGVAASTAPLLAFTDADCRPRPDWLEQLVGALASSPLAGGRIVLTTRDEPSAVERLDALWRFRQGDTVARRGWSATANLGMSREAFEAIGGFDVSFRHIGEDVDLCLRARAAGYGLAWFPEAVVEHPAETSLRPVLRRSFEQAYSLEDLRRRHDFDSGEEWRHPGPLARGTYALDRFGADLSSVPAGERRRLLALARLEYAGRMVGSVWAAIRPRLRRGH